MNRRGRRTAIIAGLTFECMILLMAYWWHELAIEWHFWRLCWDEGYFAQALDAENGSAAAVAVDRFLTSPETRPKALPISVEAVPDVPGVIPEKLRLVVHNPTQRAARFLVPGPLHTPFSRLPESSKLSPPRLGIVFEDAEGRPADLSSHPILIDAAGTSSPTPEIVNLAAGASWSREYSFGQFGFIDRVVRVPWLRGGKLLHPGPGTIRLGLCLTDASHPPGLGSLVRTNLITISGVDTLQKFGEHPSEAEQAELLCQLDDAPASRPEFTPSEEDVPSLLAVLEHSDLPAHVIFAKGLHRLGPGAHAAVPRLIELLRNEKFYGDRVVAAWVLGAIGPAAEPAIPALEAAKRDAHEHVAQVAGEALARIRQETIPPPREPLYQGLEVCLWIQLLLDPNLSDLRYPSGTAA